MENTTIYRPSWYSEGDKSFCRLEIVQGDKQATINIEGDKALLEPIINKINELGDYIPM